MRVEDRQALSPNRMKVMHPHLSVRLSRATELEYRGIKCPEWRLTVKW